jgi:hypothetical protein
MNSRKENKLKMLLALQVFLNANDTIVSKLPNYVPFKMALDAGIAEIMNNGENMQLNTKGVSGGKKQLRKMLEISTADGSGKMQAFASISNNIKLLAETKFKIGTLEHSSEVDLLNDSKLLCKKIDENMPMVIPYGLTPESQATYKELISNFETAIPQRRETEVNKQSSLQRLNQGYEAADDAADSIDLLVEIVKLTEPVFYSGYKATRRIISSASGSLAVQGTVMDATTAQPIVGATLTFQLGNGGETALVKQTAAKGGFKVKSLDEGVYTVSVSKVGYLTQTLPLTVSSTELGGLEVRLVKVSS